MQPTRSLLIAVVCLLPVLPARAAKSDAAARYAEAVILEARVEESVSALRRVMDYTHAFHLETGEGDEALTRFGEALDAARTALQADRERPAFETFDYDAIENPLHRVAVESTTLLAIMADKLRLKLGVRDESSASAPTRGEPGRTSEFDPADALLEYSLQVAALSGETSGSLPLCLGARDAATVQHLGVRVLSPDPAVFGGRDIWPVPDPFDFAEMDALVAGNASEGFQTEIRLGPLNQVPEEILAQDGLAAAGPDGLVSKEPDIFNPKARDLLLGFAQAMAGHFRGQSAVARYVLFDPPDLRNAGFTDVARAAFRSWLQTRYASLDKLNEQWRARYVDWSDIQPPTSAVGVFTRPEASLQGEFARFKAESLTLFLGHVAAALRAADPECPIGARFAASESAAADLALCGMNWNTLTQGPWDAFGLSGLGAEPPLPLRRLLSAAATRQKPKSVRVLRASPCDWLAPLDETAERLTSRNPRAQRALAEANLWLELTWKRRGIDLSSFGEEGKARGHALLSVGPSMPGVEEPAASAAPAGAPIRYAAGALPAVSEAWGRIAGQMKGTALAHGGVAVLRPESSLAIEGAVAGETGEEDLLSTVLRALLDDGFSPVLVSENALADGRDSLDEFKLLVCPEATHLRPEAHTRLIEWAQKGGRLVALGPFGLFDSLGAPLENRPVLEALKGKEPVRDLSGRWLEGTKERREFEQAPLGKGFVLQCLTFSPGERQALAQRVVAEASPLRVVNADFKRVSCVAWDGADGARYAFIVNRSLEGSANAEVSLLGRFEKPLDLLARSTPIPVAFQRGWTTMRIRLEPGQGVVVQAK